MSKGMTAEVRECLAEMGVTAETLQELAQAPSRVTAENLLDQAKQTCHKGWRTVARKYHPDHNQQLSEDEITRREERFRRLTSVHDSFMEAKLRIVNPPVSVHLFATYGVWAEDLRVRAALAKKRQADQAAHIRMVQEILNRKR